MNEILAVIYYCFWKFGNEAVISTEYLESDVFNCFSNLMAELKDGFMRDLDKEAGGIDGKCKIFAHKLKTLDPQVDNRLAQEKVNPQFYSLRWFMLLMCQDFEMPNCIRLWDTLFADHLRFDFLNYVCCAIVIQLRDIIIEGDFAACMEHLQTEAKKIPDVDELLQRSLALKQKF